MLVRTCVYGMAHISQRHSNINIPKGRYCSQFTVPVGPLGHRSIAAEKEEKMKQASKQASKEMDEEGVTRAAVADL